MALALCFVTLVWIPVPAKAAVMLWDEAQLLSSFEAQSQDSEPSPKFPAPIFHGNSNPRADLD